MSDYLDRIGSGLILLNPDPLDFDYIPEVMVGREDIQESLAGKFHSIAHPNGSANVVITGYQLEVEKHSLLERFAETSNTIFEIEDRFEAFTSTVAMLRPTYELPSVLSSPWIPAIQIVVSRWVNC